MTPKDLPVEVCACRLCTEERESETVSALGVRGYPLEVTRGTVPATAAHGTKARVQRHPDGPDMTPKEVLIAARKLIESPKQWLKGADSGLRNEIWCYCASGALMTAVDENIPPVDWDAAENALSLAATGDPDGNIPIWNDAPERTHEEVLAAFDEAIEMVS